MKNIIKALAALSLLQLTLAENPSKDKDQTSKNTTDKVAVLNNTATKSSVPAGFEDINNNYDGEASLLDAYTKIGMANIFYNENKDSITLSKQAQKTIIDYYQDKLTAEGEKELAETLKHNMPATTMLNKFYEARSDDKITCHFSYNGITLNILVPNKYFKNSTIQYKHNLYKQDPTFYTPSLKSSLYAYYDHYSGSEKTKWEATGSAASGRSSLIYDLNNTVTNHVNSLYLEYHGSKYTYDIGYKEPNLNSILEPYGNVWGLFITENPKLINNDFYSSYKTPLYLTVTKPYAVTITYRGKTLYKGTLLQGQNIIETNNFPLGTYNITISKRDLVTNDIVETTEVFSQQGSRYNWLNSGLEIVAGIESEYFNTAFTSKDEELYFHMKKGYTLFYGETDISYTFSNNTNYIGTEYNYISSDNLDYSIAASISQDLDLYFSITSTYTYGKSRYYANLYSGFQDDFSSSKNKYANLQYTYRGQDWNLNIYGSSDFDKSNTLSATISKTFNLNAMPASTYFTLQHSDDSLNYILGLSVSFDIGDNISSSTRLSHTSSDHNSSISNTTYYKNSKHNLKLSNILSIDSDSDNYDLISAEYKTESANYKSSIDIEQGDGSTDISSAYISARTNFYLTPSTYLFSSNDVNTSYIVKAPTLKNDDNVNFIINDKTAKQGETIMIAASSFSKNHLSITPSTTKYTLAKDHWDEFFYPNNFYSPNFEISKSCLVSFYADIPKEYNYTFLGMEDSLYGHGQQKSMTNMIDSSKITYVYLNKDNDQCETGVVVDCGDKTKIDLGKLSCKHSEK